MLMPNLLAIRQSRNLFSFWQYKLLINYIFHVLHTEVLFKVPVAERKAEKLLYNFVFVSRRLLTVCSSLFELQKDETM